MTFAAGDIIRPGKHQIETLPLATGTITKGNYVTSSAGNAVALAAAASTVTGKYVAVETRVFSAGSVTDVQLAGEGSFVVVLMGGAVQPGGPVKVAASNKTVVAAGADIANLLVIGHYIKHPGEDKATPAADTELGIIHIGGSS